MKQVDRQPLIRLSKCLSNFRHFRKRPLKQSLRPTFAQHRFQNFFATYSTKNNPSDEFLFFLKWNWHNQKAHRNTP